MPDLYSVLRSLRAELGLGTKLSNGALVVAAKSPSAEPEVVRRTLAGKGMVLPETALRDLVELLRRARRLQGLDGAPGPATTGPAGAGGTGRSASSRNRSHPEHFPYLTLARHRGRAVSAPQPAAGSVRPAAPEPAAAPAGPTPPAAVSPPAAGSSGTPARPATAGPTSAPPKQRTVPAGSRTDRFTAATPPVDTPPAIPPPAAPTASETGGPAGRPEPSGTDELVGYGDTMDLFAGQEHALDVRRDRDRLGLRWPPADAGPDQVLRYLLVAHPDQAPENPSGGERLLVSEQPRAELATTAGPHFAVFVYAAPTLADVPQALAVAHATGQLLPEVTELAVSAKTDSVTLAWAPPPRGTLRVEVMRSRPNERVPAKRDPSLLIPVYGEYATDADVVPGAEYQYRVSTVTAVWSNGERQEQVSAGLVERVTIPVRPRAVEGLTATVRQIDGELRVDLSWPAVEVGTVRIHHVARVPEHAARNQVISKDQLVKVNIGPPVQEPVQRDGDRMVMRGVAFPGDEGPRRTYTAVTTVGDQVCVGDFVVVDHVGDVRNIELQERVDWQFLRLSWPPGAGFLTIRQGPIGSDLAAAPARGVTHEDFRAAGGVHLGQLPLEGCDLAFGGATFFDGEWKYGAVTTHRYDGRWTLRYRLERAARLSATRRLLSVQVERSWPAVSIAVLGTDELLPLTAWDENATVLGRFDLQQGQLPPGGWVTLGEVEVRSPLARVFAYAPGITPIVLDPTGERAIPLVRPPRSAGWRPGQSKAVPMLRCPSCLESQPLFPQRFRCVGSCAESPDALQSEFTKQPVNGRPVLMANGQETATEPVDHLFCTACGTRTEQQVCGRCHSPLPLGWGRADPLAVILVGARGTGKTTYASGLLTSLKDSAIPALGGVLRVVDRPHDDLGKALGSGQPVFESTQRAEANQRVLRPLLLEATERSGGRRELALFDAAGEDMQRADGVRRYGRALSGGDAIVFLLDPLQLAPVRAYLDGRVALPPVESDPTDVLHNITTEVRRRRSQHAGRLPGRLAVVVSKFDGLQLAVTATGTPLSGKFGPGSPLMRDPYAALPGGFLPDDSLLTHQEVRALLVSLKAGSFVGLAESTFEDVRYFAVSALGHGPRNKQISDAGPTPFRVADPMRWLLASTGS